MPNITNDEAVTAFTEVQASRRIPATPKVTPRSIIVDRILELSDKKINEYREINDRIKTSSVRANENQETNSTHNQDISDWSIGTGIDIDDTTQEHNNNSTQISETIEPEYVISPSEWVLPENMNREIKDRVDQYVDDFFKSSYQFTLKPKDEQDKISQNLKDEVYQNVKYFIQMRDIDIDRKHFLNECISISINQSLTEIKEAKNKSKSNKVKI